MRRNEYIFGFFVLCMIVLSHAPALQFEHFVYDGGRMLYRNATVRGSGSLDSFFRSDYWGHTGKQSIGSYRPLAVATLWAEFQLWGDRVLGYIMMQFVWLFAACWFFFLFLKEWKLPRWVVMGAVALFAIHPIHTEAVVSLAGRADLMMACFFVWALWLHIRKRFKWTWLVVALGLLSKEIFLIFPVVTLTMDVCRNLHSYAPIESLKERFKKVLSSLHWSMYGVYGLSAVAFLVLQHWALGSVAHFPHGADDNPLLGASIGIRLLHAPVLLGRYVLHIFYPFALSPDRTFNTVPLVQNLGDLRLWWGVACCSVLIWGLWRARKAPYLLWWLCLGIGVYVPVSNVLIAGPILMADRWMLLVLLPVSVGVSWCMYQVFLRVPEWRPILRFVCLTSWIVLMAITFDYTHHWRSSLTLFQYAAQRTPNNLKVRYIYGQELLRHRKPLQAVRQFKAALQIRPSFFLGTLALVRSYEYARQLDEAERLLRRSMQIVGPHQPKAWMHWVLFLRRHKRLKEARKADRIFRSRFGAWLKKMQGR